MDKSFDPYLKWLGIPKRNQPPHHYRLLGIEMFESDPEVISNAADQRMAHLKNFAVGQYSALSQTILNEIAAARVCLLNDSQKENYDAILRDKMQSQKPLPLKTAAAIPAAAVHTAAEQSPVVNVKTSAGAGRTDTRDKGRRVAKNPLVWILSAAAAAILGIFLFSAYVNGLSKHSDPVADVNNNLDRSQDGQIDQPQDLPSDKEPADKPPVAETPIEKQPADKPATDSESKTTSPVDKPSVEPTDKPPVEPTDEPAVETIDKPPVESPDKPPVEPPVRPPVEPIDKPPVESPDKPPVESPDKPPVESPVRPPVEPPVTRPADERPVVQPPLGAKVAAPTVEQKKASLTEIRDIYKDDFNLADTPAAKRGLADTLYSEARNSGSDRVPQFVLFELSAKTATEASDLTRAFRALDSIDSIFDVDVLGMKTDMLEELAKAALQRTGTAAQNEQVVRVSRELCEKALEDTELRVADKLMRIALPAARKLKDRQLVVEIEEASRKVSRLRTQQRQVEKAREILETTPDDPEASLTAGNWYCFVVGDWEKGLPWLAQCGNADLARAAAFDLKNPRDPADLVTAGDGWWDIAEKKSGVETYRLRKRAVHWYEKAIGSLSGLTKTKVAKRLRETGDSLGKFALKFDAQKSHVVVNNFVYPGTTPITVEAVVKVDPNLAYQSSSGSSNYARRRQTIVSNVKYNGLFLGSYYSNWRAEFYYAYKRSSYSSYVSTSQATLTSTSTIVPNRWTHLALVFDGSSVKLFVDGRMEGSSATRGMHKPGSMPFIVGASAKQLTSDDSVSASDFFGGSIKALRISNTARYTENFRPPASFRPDSAGKLLFDFREGQGTRLNSAGKTNAFGMIKDAKWIKVDEPAAKSSSGMSKSRSPATIATKPGTR